MDALTLVDDLHNALVELKGEEGVPVELVNPNVASKSKGLYVHCSGCMYLTAART